MRLSPRQRMINLMYIVLTAMLALNVSSDVLDGFVQVQSGLSRTNENFARRNDAVYAQLTAFTAQNPANAAPSPPKATDARPQASALYAAFYSLIQAIVVNADGPDGDINDIRRRDDLESAAVVMLNPMTRRGEKLRGSIDSFRKFIGGYIIDPVKRKSVEASLNTDPFRRPGVAVAQPWEQAKFENQPVVAAVTLLTKLQNDIRYAEGEALQSLMANVDAGDVRVNLLNAFVIPQSRMVMRGGKYSANIVLAAIDTTSRPEIYIGGSRINNPNGLYEFVTSKTGTFN